MAKKGKEIKLDDLEEELTETEEIEEESEEDIKEIDEFSLEGIEEVEEDIGEIFEEEIEEIEEAPKEEIVDERMYIIPLAKARRGPRNKRAKKTIRFLRQFMERHFKPESLVISQEVNEAIWKRGAQKPPRKLKVRTTKNIDGLVVVYLA